MTRPPAVFPTRRPLHRRWLLWVLLGVSRKEIALRSGYTYMSVRRALEKYSYWIDEQFTIAYQMTLDRMVDGLVFKQTQHSKYFKDTGRAKSLQQYRVRALKKAIKPGPG